MRIFSCLFLMGASLLLRAQDLNVEFRSKFTWTNKTLANVWGYAQDDKEYALVGTKTGLSIVDVTNPDDPDEIVLLNGVSSSWREIKTYSHYAYVVSEGGDGVFIVDLEGLPTPPPPADRHSYFGNGAINGLLQKAHALHIDESAGYLYVYGSYLSNNSNGGKPLVFNLNVDPFNPSYVGVYTPPFSPVYAHDGYVDSDIMYSAHINAGKFAIVDMANKSAPVTLGTKSTPGNFTHNTWPNGNVLFTTDEVNSSFLTAYDVSDPDDITELDRIQSNPGSGSIVHNTHIINEYAVTSWYKDGITIVDVSRPSNLIQTGNYDTYPNDSGGGFNGCWGVYPYLPSGNILATNISAQGTQNGELFVLTPTYVRGCYLEGKVRQASNGQPIVGALVEIIGTDAEAATIAGGTYKTGWHESGNYDVRVSKTGFQTWNGSVALSNGDLTILDVALMTPAAVEMLRFDVQGEEDDAVLSWATATERDNKGFDIQHSIGSLNNWKSIGFVAGQGDADAVSEYRFKVDDLAPGQHFFRLRQVDFDGTDSYTDVRSLQVKNSAFWAEMWPNAVSSQSNLRLFSEKPQQVTVEILDATGYNMGISWNFLAEREMTLPIEVSVLPPGVYFTHIITEIGDDIVLRWVRQ
ncbi:MAG: choice-of-anchor B family protein [Saprospiraceae bacterium]|nr:choice-of-anchor B family protein [Saprospiraceae bacterium]